MIHLLETGAVYAATISLGFVDRLASNEQVKEKFESVGFTEVQVLGSGKRRTVKGKWTGKTEEHEVPSQVDSIEEAMTDHDRMIVDARTFYSEWQRNRPFSRLSFRLCLNYFEHKEGVGQSGEFQNLYSKMKLLFNLSGQRA